MEEELTTIGYLFEDDRDLEAPYVLFVEGLEPEEGDEDAKSMEIRFTNMIQAITMTAKIYEEIGPFDTYHGEPDHFELIREEAG